MKLKLNRVGEPFQLIAETEEGNEIEFDAAEKAGGMGKGIRPMEALASSLAACASIDVLHILRKQKLRPSQFEVEITAERRDSVPAIFKNIHLNFKLKSVPKNKAERAIDLSLRKYCSVSRVTRKLVFKMSPSTKVLHVRGSYPSFA